MEPRIFFYRFANRIIDSKKHSLAEICKFIQAKPFFCILLQSKYHQGYFKEQVVFEN